MLQEKAKLQESLGESLSLGSGFKCEDHEVGMFCTLCKKWGRLPSAKDGWMTKGIVDWNHATELLKQLNGTKTHQSLQEWLSM